MTVSSTSRRAGPFTGNGVTTSFPFAFKVFAKGDLALTLTDTSTGAETALTLDTHYSVTLNANQDTSPGGTITYPVSGAKLSATQTLVAVGDLAASQGLDITNAGKFLPQVIEDALDRATILNQQVLERTNRALIFSVNEAAPVSTLPALAGRAGMFLAFDADGNPTAASGTGADGALRADIAAAVGALLMGWSNSGTAISVGAALDLLYFGVANVMNPRFAGGAKGDGVTDDTAAFKAAIAACRNIFLPSGTFLTNFGDAAVNPTYITNIPSNTTFVGAGASTVWKPYTITARGCIGTDSGAAGAFSENISFRNISFQGDVTVAGLNQQAHLVYLSGVKHVRIQDCTFYGMRGDGLYIGSGFGAGAGYERHNFDVTVKSCLFDGANNHNRNGISVIDVDGMVIDGCTFTRLSDATMPGSIDFEPDDTYSVIKNVQITNSKFGLCTGSGGHINIAVGAIAYTNFQNFLIQGNHFANSNGVVINTNSATPGSAPGQPNSIVVNANTFFATQWPLYVGVGSLWGLEFIGNQVFSSFAGGGWLQIGHPTDSAANWRTRALVISDNRIFCSNAYAIKCNETIQYGRIDNNIIDGATTAPILMGLASSSTTNVSITNNMFLGAPTYTVDQQATTKNGIGNTYKNNTAASLTATHTFEAWNTDNSGATSNLFDKGTQPQSFPMGVSTTQITNKDIVSGAATDVGMLVTERKSSVAHTNTIQWFYPQYDATFLDRVYFRKATSGGAWSAWFLLTGV